MEKLILEHKICNEMLYQFNYKVNPQPGEVDMDDSYVRAIICMTASPLVTWRDIVVEFNSKTDGILETATKIHPPFIVSYSHNGFYRAVTKMEERDGGKMPFEHYVEHVAKELVMRRDVEQSGCTYHDQWKYWPKD